MEIASKNFTIPLHTAVYLEGNAITVEVFLGDDDQGTQTIVSLDSLLREYLDMHEFFDGGGYDPEALAGLIKLRKLADCYIRKIKAHPPKSGARGGRGGRRG